MNESLPSEVSHVFGANLRRLREWRGWSQSELARQMREAGWPKYSQVAVSRTEEGTRSVRLDEAIALARVLERSVQDLLDPKAVVDSWARLRAVMEDYSWKVTGVRNAVAEYEDTRLLLTLLRHNLGDAISQQGGAEQVSDTMTRTLANADKLLSVTAHDLVDQVQSAEEMAAEEDGDDPDDIRDRRGDR